MVERLLGRASTRPVSDYIGNGFQVILKEISTKNSSFASAQELKKI